MLQKAFKDKEEQALIVDVCTDKLPSQPIRASIEDQPASYIPQTIRARGCNG